MTDEFAQWRADLTRNIERQLDLIKTRLTTLRATLTHADHGAYLTPSAEVIASEVLQLTLLASQLDQLTNIEKEI